MKKTTVFSGIWKDELDLEKKLDIIRCVGYIGKTRLED